jgi:hypothetical protein
VPLTARSVVASFVVNPIQVAVRKTGTAKSPRAEVLWQSVL